MSENGDIGRATYDKAFEMTVDQLGCGSFTMMGHGDNAICGQPYMNEEIFQCAGCKIKTMRDGINTLQCDTSWCGTAGNSKCQICRLQDNTAMVR
jgi:hypothetical protein